MITNLRVFKILEGLNIAENELKEGLIMTHDPYSSIQSILKFARFNQINLENIKSTRLSEFTYPAILIKGIQTINTDIFANFLIRIKNLGYYISHVSLMNFKGVKTELTYEDFKNSGFFDDFENKYLNIDLILDPKFDLIRLLPTDTLFHVTEKRFIKRILKEGLVPRSENTLVDYPTRVYFSYSIENAEEYLLTKGQFYIDNPEKNYTHIKRNNKEEKDKSIVILKVVIPKENKIAFYEDPYFVNKGIYTYDNIPPNWIEILKR